MRSYFTTAYITKKWGHGGFRRYLSNTGWIFFGKLASLAISFVATAYIARNLGPTNYGQLSYTLSYVSLFGFLATLGIDQVLYRDLIKYPEKRDSYLGTAIFLRLAAGLLTIFLCLGSAVLFSDKDVSLILIAIVSLTFLFNPFQLLNYEFQAQTESKYPAFVSLVVVFVLNSLKILVIALNQGVIYLAGVILIEPVLYAIGFAYLRARKYGSVKNLSFDPGTARTMLRESLPLMFASAFFAIYARIDQVMIKNMIDSGSVGLYDAAVRISEIWYFVPNLIVISLYPALLNAKEVSRELYAKRISKLLVLILFVSAVSSLLTVVLSEKLVAVIFGTGFIGAASILNIYVWSNIGAAVTHLMQQVLVAENLSSKVSASVFAGMAANVFLNLILIPEYGLVGAAWATLVSYFVPILSLVFFRDTRSLVVRILSDTCKKKH